MNMIKTLFLITCVSLLSACQTTQIERQTGFEEINPKSILILPVVNKSVDVDAPLGLCCVIRTENQVVRN
ncbi:hypothetical protein CGJ93_22030 [Vibrio parahaemolyticus]|nr:hypothetical protein CGJ93_22030 [Vibrio parahaemolyticus]